MVQCGEWEDKYTEVRTRGFWQRIRVNAFVHVVSGSNPSTKSFWRPRDGMLAAATWDKRVTELSNTKYALLSHMFQLSFWYGVGMEGEDTFKNRCLKKVFSNFYFMI